MKRNITQTKYPFIIGIQCDKAYWLHYHRPHLAEPVSEEQKILFQNGKDVGLIGRNLYPGGTDVISHDNLYGTLLTEATKKILQSDGQVFYEPQFRSDDGRFVTKLDILVRVKKELK